MPLLQPIWLLQESSLKSLLTKSLTLCIKVRSSLPTAFRETAEGGLATTPTGRKLSKEIFGE